MHGVGFQDCEVGALGAGMSVESCCASGKSSIVPSNSSTQALLVNVAMV